LVWVWYIQYIFFRRYGLQDNVTIALNAALLFVVLFYVYPLKFLFTLVINQFTAGDLMVHRPDGSSRPMIEPGQVTSLMLIYGAGFVAVFLLFALLFRHAWGKRKELQLSETEIFETGTSVQYCLLNAGVGLVSMGIAFLGGERATSLAGWSYFLLGPVAGFHETWRAKRRRKLEAAGRR